MRTQAPDNRVSVQAFNQVASDGLARQAMVRLPEGNEELNDYSSASVGSGDLFDCTSSGERDGGDICNDRIGMAGITLDDDSNFIAVTTRGPVQNCSEIATLSSDVSADKYEAKDTVGEGFAVPDFKPLYLQLQYDSSSGAISINGNAEMDKSGVPTDGSSSDVYGFQCEGSPLDLSQYQAGISPADISLNPFGSGVLVADAYGPALYSGAALGDGATSREAAAPGVLSENKRGTNSGYGAVTKDPNNNWVVAVMASPLVSNQSTARVVRAVLYDGGFEGNPKQIAVPLSSNKAYKNFAQQEDVRVAAAAPRDSDSILMLERTDDQAKIFAVSGLNNASDVTDESVDALEGAAVTKSVEMLDGITPATRRKVWDSEYSVGGTLNFEGSAEIEGMEIINNNTVLLVTNNRFGYQNRGATQVHVMQLGRELDGITVTEEGTTVDTPSNRDRLTTPSKELAIELESQLRRANEPSKAFAEKVSIDKLHNTGSIALWSVKLI